jgi:hypothetical protein
MSTPTTGQGATGDDATALPPVYATLVKDTALPAPQNPPDTVAADRLAAERYLTEVLGVPGWALPSGTAYTPLHPLSVQVRNLAVRRGRLLARLATALETQQGQAERARGVTQDGVLPSWSLLEPGPAAETAATAEALRMLDVVLGELSATLALTCSQVDRWLKAEAPGVTLDTMGSDGVIAAACDWVDVRNLPDRGGRAARTASATGLTDAVAAYRRGLAPTVTMQPGLAADEGPAHLDGCVDEGGGFATCADGCPRFAAIAATRI